MAKKVKKTYSIDSSTASKFQQVCESKGLEYSATLEKFMENFIIKGEEALIDDLYAPRIAAMVRHEIEKQTDRTARIMYNTQVDVRGILLSIPSMYIKNSRMFETILDTWINPQLLNPVGKRQNPSKEFTYNEHGWEMIDNLQDAARKDITRSAQDARSKKDREKEPV